MDIKFSEGECVLIKTHGVEDSSADKKLSPKYQGEFAIVKQLVDLSYLIRSIDPRAKNDIQIHVKRLKRKITINHNFCQKTMTSKKDGVSCLMSLLFLLIGKVNTNNDIFLTWQFSQYWQNQIWIKTIDGVYLRESRVQPVMYADQSLLHFMARLDSLPRNDYVDHAV